MYNYLLFLLCAISMFTIIEGVPWEFEEYNSQGYYGSSDQTNREEDRYRDSQRYYGSSGRTNREEDRYGNSQRYYGGSGRTNREEDRYGDSQRYYGGSGLNTREDNSYGEGQRYHGGSGQSTSYRPNVIGNGVGNRNIIHYIDDYSEDCVDPESDGDYIGNGYGSRNEVWIKRCARGRRPSNDYIGNGGFNYNTVD